MYFDTSGYILHIAYCCLFSNTPHFKPNKTPAQALTPPTKVDFRMSKSKWVAGLHHCLEDLKSCPMIWVKSYAIVIYYKMWFPYLE